MASREKLLGELGMLVANRAKLEDKLINAQKKRGEIGAECKNLHDLIAKANTAVRECEHELLTGLTGMPLIDAADKKERERDSEEKKEAKRKSHTGKSPPTASAESADGHIDAEEAAEVIEKHLERVERHTSAWELAPELVHSLKRSSELSAALLKLAEDGPAGDGAIAETIKHYWPGGRVFVPSEQGGGANGYTYSRNGSYFAIWLGPFKGIGHECDFGPAEIKAAARQIFSIEELLDDSPRPAKAAIRVETNPSVMGEPKRGRGRPPGAKNKPKAADPLMHNLSGH